jgi:replicative superfamily II helicase
VRLLTRAEGMGRTDGVVHVMVYMCTCTLPCVWVAVQERRESVLVAAHTSAGKTVVAE